MDLFFNPAGIALIGASASPSKGGNAITVNLKRGYRGGIYPVNPRYPEVEGLPCYASVAQVPDPVDLAIVFIPAHGVPDAIRQCAERGIRRVIIESGGFAETGPAGAELQAEAAAVARRHAVRLWGPNCMGLVDAVRRHVFSFVTPALWEDGLPPGDVSLVVQSGMLSGGFLVDIISHGIMGISKVCSIGNKMDVNECDVLEYLLQDPQTGVVGLYLEGVAEGRRLMALCRGSRKPVVVLKGGKSAGGAAAAMSHTASMAGNGAVLSGALAQAGVVEAHDFKQMMDICRSLSFYPEPPPTPRGRVAVLTFSGGAGIVSADFLEETGLRLAALAPDTLRRMQAVFPEWMPVSNPVDLWPAVEKNGADASYAGALRAVCQDPGVDAVLMHTFIGGFNLKPDIDALAAVARSAGKPLFCWMLGRQAEAREFQIHARSLGVPVFSELYRAVECLNALFSAAEIRAAASGDDVSSPVLGLPAKMTEAIAGRSGVLDEYDAKQMLGACGIPVAEEAVAPSWQAAREIARRIGFPVVLKALVPGEVHKSEAGRVRLQLGDEPALRRAFGELEGTLPPGGRILVQGQVAGRLEVIAGMVRDPQFGPCVMVGMGGVMAEILDDSVFAVAPLTRLSALRLIGRLKHQRLLDGFRGDPPADRDALADILVRLAQLAIALPHVDEVDLNPLVISRGRPVAVDAVIRLVR